MCDSDFPVRSCSVCARNRNKLYVGECMALTIGLREIFGLCTFDSPYSLGGRGLGSFNVNLVLLRMLLFSIRILMFCAICLFCTISWIFVKLFVCFIREKILHLFLIVWCIHNYCHVAFIGWKHDDVYVSVQVLESQSLLSSDVWWREFSFEKDIGYLSANIICLFRWESVDGW